MTDVATVPNGHVQAPAQRADEQIDFSERAAKRPCPDSDGAADRLAASLDATVPFSAVHEWWQVLLFLDIPAPFVYAAAKFSICTQPCMLLCPLIPRNRYVQLKSPAGRSRGLVACNHPAPTLAGRTAFAAAGRDGSGQPAAADGSRRGELDDFMHSETKALRSFHIRYCVARETRRAIDAS